MSTTARALIVLALVVEFAALSYTTLMAWLVSAWFLDDAIAESLQPTDWWVIAGQRFAICAIAAAAISVVVYVMNRWLARIAHRPASRLPVVIAVLFVVLPVGASFVGSLQFGITKPYM